MWFQEQTALSHVVPMHSGTRSAIRDGARLSQTQGRPGSSVTWNTSGRKAETPLGHSHANMNLKATSKPVKRTNKKADTDRVGYPGGGGCRKG